MNAQSALRLRIAAQLPVSVSRFSQEELSVNLQSDGNVRALIYAEPPEAGISNSGRPMLGVFSTQDVPRSWIELLQGIEVGRWPAGFVPETPNSYLFDFFPAGMRDLCIKSAEGLAGRLREFFGLLRWRLHDHISAGAQISPGKLEWSVDGTLWRRVRMPLEVSFQVLPQIRLGPEVHDSLNDLVDTNTKEPLGRDIWHVAVHTDARTAVILAVTAVEVEVKRLISEVVPESEWLVANLPSPPIVRLIKTYLPTIIDIPLNRVPSSRLMRAMGDAVGLRNSFVHGGFEATGGWASASNLSAKDVEEILDVSSDLLWLFDLYRGRDWAIGYMSEETRQELQRNTARSEEPDTRKP